MSQSSLAFMPRQEYETCLKGFLSRGGQQINLLGGEPLMYPLIRELIAANKAASVKTTVYTNGLLLPEFRPNDLLGAKLRISLYSMDQLKGVNKLPRTDIPFDANFMVSAVTTTEELLAAAAACEKDYGCRVFFLFSMRELDNPAQDFFTDTLASGSLLHYKRLVHEFLSRYEGGMDIHVSKRGVFESTTTLPDTRCRFANYFTGGRIIQCPYDVVNLKFQDDYAFGQRPCQQNSTCLMSKVIYRPLTSKASAV